MTGFGSAAHEADGRRAQVEVRSVNHRFLKVNVKLPTSLSAHEADIEARVKKAVRRGSVTVTVRYDKPGAEARYMIDQAAVRHYVESLSAVEAACGERVPESTGRLSIALGLPGVVRENERDEADQQAEQALLHKAVDEALAALIKNREEEGSHLRQVLERHGDEVARLVTEAAARAEKVPQQQRDRLLERVNRLLQDMEPRVELSEPDLLREVCLLADRLDVSEELDRLRGHLGALKKTLTEGHEVGRKLDFLMQELNREANTVGSKANDTELAHLVVALKCEIERLREQVQNIE